LDQLERAWKKWLAVAGLTMRGENNPITAGAEPVLVRKCEFPTISEKRRKPEGNGAKAKVIKNEREKPTLNG
jgi:hypothetical protein